MQLLWIGDHGRLDLHHIEAEDKVEWDNAFTLLTEHTDLLESQLTSFV